MDKQLLLSILGNLYLLQEQFNEMEGEEAYRFITGPNSDSDERTPDEMIDYMENWYQDLQTQIRTTYRLISTLA